MSARPSASGQTHWIDVRTEPHEDVLQHVERVLGVRLDRSSVVYGSYGTTEGFRTDRDTWMRIARRQRWRINGPAWTGAEAASVLRGVAKPDWIQCVSWIDDPRGVVWRADEMELIASPVIEKMSGFGVDTELSDSWWESLKESLAMLGEHETDRVGMRQAHLSMRINQVFDGQVDTTVDEWVTAHVDLHWGNLTVDCHLLDWEDWGAAPRGLDATYLWGSSLPYPALAARVQREFEADLQTRSGRLAQLLQCANIIRIAAKRGTATPLLEPAREAADLLLAELRL